MRKQPAPLVIPGAPKKGEAAPAIRSFEPEPSQPSTEQQPSVSAPAPAPASIPAQASTPSRLSSRVQATIAVTVRLDEMRYERMKKWGSTDRRVTNQEIIVAALDQFFSLSDEEREEAISFIRR
jgi:hypothetical protein